MLTCLDNIIGLSRGNCPCLDNSKPNDFAAINLSKTGWYITDREYTGPVLDAILEANDCQDGTTVWSTLQDIRQAAIRTFEPDLIAALKTKFQSIDTWIDEIGKRSFSTTRNKQNQYQGVRIIPKKMKGFSFFVRNIYIGLNETRSVTIKIRSNNPDFTERTLVLNAIADTFHKNTLSTPIELPFYSRAHIENFYTNNRFAYDFYYEVGTSKYLDNEVQCGGCTGSAPRWSKFFEVGGFDTNNLDTIQCPCTRQGMGLVIDGYVTCDSLGWICELENIGGYEVQQTIAEALLWKCVELMCNHILDSPNSNFWTTLQREQLYGKRNHARSEYEGRIGFIAMHLPKGATDCYQCKETIYLGSL